MNVLVLSGGGFQGHTVLKELSAIQEVTTFVLDIYEDNVTRYFTSHYSTIVPISHPEFKNKLTSFCKENDIHVIFPSTVHELEVLAELKKSTGTPLIAVCKKELLAILHDKKSAFDFLTEHNFPVGKKMVVENTTATNFFPVIVKPKKGFGGKGISILDHYSNLKLWLENNNPDDFVFQEFLKEHHEYSADFAIDFKGNVSNVILRSRIRQTGGFAIITEIVDNPRIHNSVKQLAELFAANGGCGIFNVQVLESKDQFLFTDINPRMGTSAILGTQNGNNLCAFILISCGLKPRTLSFEKKAKAIRYLAERYIPTKNSKIKNVIFDLDDTLFPHKQWITGKLELLHDACKLSMSKDEFLSVGLRILEEGHRSDLLDKIAIEFNFTQEFKQQLIEVYRTLIPKIEIYNDVIPTLIELKRQKIKIGLLTDNPPTSQKQKLTASGLDKYIDHIIFSRDAGGDKPLLATFNLAIKNMSADVKETAFVGDNLYKDILGAHEAGIETLCWLPRTGGFFNFDENEFRKYHPHVRFSKFEDMFHLMGFLK